MTDKVFARRPPSRGFTLIELMIVVAIIGILAAIAIPKFADLVRKSQEGRTKGNLTTIRSALSVYYGDNEGIFPYILNSGLTSGEKYLKEMPKIVVPAFTDQGNTGHGETQAVSTLTDYAASSVTDSGNWGYVNNNANINWGKIFVACTHNDSKGTVWNQR